MTGFRGQKKVGEIAGDPRAGGEKEVQPLQDTPPNHHGRLFREDTSTGTLSTPPPHDIIVRHFGYLVTKVKEVLKFVDPH